MVNRHLFLFLRVFLTSEQHPKPSPARALDVIVNEYRYTLLPADFSIIDECSPLKELAAPPPTLLDELQRRMEGRLNEYLLDPYPQPIEGREKTPLGRPKALAIAGEKIRALRGKASQGTFCRLCKISKDTLQKAERGTATEATIILFCEYAAKNRQT
jgi:hypothetical protein